VTQSTEVAASDRVALVDGEMPGATWTWCYVHEAEGRLGQDDSGS